MLKTFAGKRFAIPLGDNGPFTFSGGCMGSDLLEKPWAVMDEDMKNTCLRCAKSYMQMREWKKASAEYDALLECFPEDAHILESAALCYQYLGESQKALAFLEKAFRIFEAMGLFAKMNQVKKYIRNY